jgi:hypothetical protein
MDSYTYVYAEGDAQSATLTDYSATREDSRPPADSYRRRSPGKLGLFFELRAIFLFTVTRNNAACLLPAGSAKHC